MRREYVYTIETPDGKLLSSKSSTTKFYLSETIRNKSAKTNKFRTNQYDDYNGEIVLKKYKLVEVDE